MLRSYIILLLFSLLHLSCFTQNTKKLNQVINLNSSWEFTSGIYNKSYPAKIPGSIHSDLFINELIPDPFTDQNEEKLQWIDTSTWIYSLEFHKPKNLHPQSHVELVFKGLDTYSEIYLNDSLLGSTNNMFVPWEFSIDPTILKNKNTLTLKFKPSKEIEQALYSGLPYPLPGGSRSCTRKAAYQYGWDWVPSYVSCGIWQDVELHTWETAKINTFNYTIEKLDSNIAIVNLKTEIHATKDFTGHFEINTENQDLKYSFNEVPIKKGTHNYDFQIEINKPQFWWTHNLGEPYIYNFEIQLLEKNQKYDSQKINVGLRTIELVQNPDEYGKSFYFKLNNIPVFMKGANYVPQSSFPGAVSDANYRKIISDAKLANMNMLRVWGGGIYEKDIFYDLCDKEGILIWQDFMFANTMYPKDSLFLENIKNEARFQVKRLSNHPSIAVWCGNNEIDEAWHNWGWSNNYSKEDSAEIWNNYENIFHHLLPSVVKEVSPTISYTSSSPLFGRGNPRSSFEGDNHYWYVWHDAYDFNWYNKVTGRFMSEFGFQSFPSIETIDFFDNSPNKSIDSEIMLAHQKHHKGNFLINHYMKDYYPVPDNFEDFVYVSQLLQAEGIRTGILAQRRAKPFCMGSLYWQLNDCWPAISWSSIDYSGNWKALHYYAKRDFKNTIAIPYINKDSLKIYVISDDLKNIDIKINIFLMDFYGQKKFKSSIEAKNVTNESRLVFNESIENILKQNNTQNHLVYIELKHNEKLIDTRTVLFEKPKDLQLDKINFYSKINTIKDGYEIVLNSSVFIKSLFIETDFDGKLSDNYFDLIPGIEKRITFKTNKIVNNPAQYFKYKSVNQILNAK